MLTVPVKVFTPGLVHSPSSVQRTSARSVWPFLFLTVTCAGSGTALSCAPEGSYSPATYKMPTTTFSGSAVTVSEAVTVSVPS